MEGTVQVKRVDGLPSCLTITREDGFVLSLSSQDASLVIFKTDGTTAKDYGRWNMNAVNFARRVNSFMKGDIPQ